MAANFAKDDVPLAPVDRQPPDIAMPDPPQRKAGWAIVGLGKLAVEEIMPAFALCKRSRPAALVSGHPDKAKRIAEAYGIDPKNIYDYESYDRLAENKDVDIVYNVLPNSMHAEYTIRAHQAGKHVLCEKPMAATVRECEEMIAAASKAKRQLMVAYRLHYEPFNLKVMELCREKCFGAIRTIASTHCQTVEAPNIRLSKELAGGALGDLGVYSLNAARYITGEEPIEVSAFAYRPDDDPRFREVDRDVSFLLRFPSGALAHCDCGFAGYQSRRYNIQCADGLIEMNPAFGYEGLRLFVEHEMKCEELTLEAVNHFAAEMDHFSECVLDGAKCRTPGEEGLADMRVLAAIEKSIQSGRAEKVSG